MLLPCICEGPRRVPLSTEVVGVLRLRMSRRLPNPSSRRTPQKHTVLVGESAAPPRRTFFSVLFLKKTHKYNLDDAQRRAARNGMRNRHKRTTRSKERGLGEVKVGKKAAGGRCALFCSARIQRQSGGLLCYGFGLAFFGGGGSGGGLV